MADNRMLPIPLKIPKTVKKIVVHDGIFHADDVFCVALLKECYDENITVRRVPHNADFRKYGNDTLVCDVGGAYDGEYKFDHHQINIRKLSTKELRAAIGLLWDSYGNELYHRTTSLFHDIDKHDNDCKRFRSQLCVTIGAFNPDWNATEKERDNCFNMAVNVARQMIRASMVSDTYNMRAYREVSENSEIIKNVMFLKTRAPYEHCIGYYPEVVLVARKQGSTYKLKAVNNHSFDAQWSGKPPFPGMSMSNWIITTDDIDTVYKIKNLVERRSNNL